MAFAIFTNISISLFLAGINCYLSIKIYRDLLSQINQKGGGKVVSTLSYIFLTKFSLIAIAILGSGASPFCIFCLLGLDLAEYGFIQSQKPRVKKFVKQ